MQKQNRFTWFMLAVAVLMAPVVFAAMPANQGSLTGFNQLASLVSPKTPPKITPKTTTASYDVIIVGAGTGGSAAAIQAARLGEKVALLEETDWIGGQMTAAAVSTMDGGHDSGIYKEFMDKVLAYYRSVGKTPACGFTGLATKCFEPSVGQRILRQMLAEAGQKGGSIKILERTRVTRVLKNGNTVTGVQTQNGATLNAKVVIDATEYGDLLPLAGIPYRVGNGTSINPKPSSCVQDITYTAVIRKYPNGVPANLTIKTPPPGYNDTVKNRFATIVKTDGNTVMWTGYPYSVPVHNAYRCIPNSLDSKNYSCGNYNDVTKTGINWANDWPSEYPYVNYTTTTKLSVRYIEDPAYRKTANCEAKLKTIQFLYYLQHDLKQSSWSVANDEGYATMYNISDNSCPNIPVALKAIEQNMPPIPYVRESRRMIGLHTLTAPEMKRVGTPPQGKTAFSSSIAVGDYANDLHNCNTEDTIERDLESRSDSSGRGFFQIPIESLIPQTADGFLAAEKNISQSRLAAGATRLQPITMMTGQAAGALAALAVQKGIQPRQVKIQDVQLALVQAGAVISQYTFTDMPEIGTPKWRAVQLVSARGIMTGSSNNVFGMNQKMTRAQAAIMIARLFNLEVTTGSYSFTDVSAGSVGADEIEALYRNGFTSGCSASPRKFCPNEKINRGQLAVFLGKGLGAANASVAKTAYFEDVPSSHSFFKFVQFIYEKGVTAGCSASPLKFCPENTPTKGDIAVLVANTLGK